MNMQLFLFATLLITVFSPPFFIENFYALSELLFVELRIFRVFLGRRKPDDGFFLSIN